MDYANSIGADWAVRNHYGAGRKSKRYWSKRLDGQPVYLAYTAGAYDNISGKPKRNPYPPGRRHNEYERGFVGGAGETI